MNLFIISLILINMEGYSNGQHLDGETFEIVDSATFSVGTSVASVRDVVDCGLRCLASTVGGACQSASFNSASRTCRISNVYVEDSALTRDAQATTMRVKSTQMPASAPTSTYSVSCTKNDTCTDTFTACWEGMCKCMPGYSYISSTNECVDTCSTYGNTYEKYTGYGLACAVKVEYSSTTVSECLDLCSASPTCLSAGYGSMLSTCLVQECDPMTDNLTLFYELSMYDVYVRNCA